MKDMLIKNLNMSMIYIYKNYGIYNIGLFNLIVSET